MECPYGCGHEQEKGEVMINDTRALLKSVAPLALFIALAFVFVGTEGWGKNQRYLCLLAILALAIWSMYSLSPKAKIKHSK